MTDQASPLPPGIYSNVPAHVYHSDPAPPSLSASIAALLVNRSPRHAWAAHPQLNPEYERIAEQKFDVGTVAHAVLLRQEDPCHIVDAPDWRTNFAKGQRDFAREHGRIPLLTHQYEEVEAMVESIRWQLAEMDVDPPLFADGQAEETLVWEDQGVTCRARLDWLRDDRAAIDDLKTTSGSAHSYEWARRRLWQIGTDVQARFYVRGVKALTGEEPEFRLVVAETDPPHGIGLVSLSAAAAELADAKVDRAIALWRRCLERDEWPGYPAEVVPAEVPAWELERWYETQAVGA